MIAYRRPDLVFREFHDDSGASIRFGRRWDGMPPDEAYGRETYTERYQPLVDVARSIVAQLPHGYAVAIEPGDASQFEHPGKIIETMAIGPMDASQPLLLAITDFPGVMVRTGSGGEIAFPPCGCDACDEDVLTQIEDLESVIESETGAWLVR